MTRPLRIAVADDEADMREYLGRTLPLLGHTVVVLASTGEELLVGCRAHRPDLVITDIKMPGVDGLAAMDEICRETPVPVIVLTGYQDREHRERALRPWVRAYVLKPVKRADLEAALRVASS